MKILFVERKLRIDKLGICFLSAALKQAGHEVDLVQDEMEGADKYLDGNSVDFVMYSVTSDEADWVSECNQKLKASHNFLSVVGGPHPTFAPEWGTKDNAIDYVVQGPGEEAVLKIIDGSAEKLSRGNLLGRFNYFSPDRSIIYKYKELGNSRMKRFIACRYCLFSCTHCFNNAFKKIYRDQRSSLTYRPPPEIMIREIIEVKKAYGLELAFFNDDDLAGSMDWISQFCDLLPASGVNVGFCGSIRANSVNENAIKMMAEAGCRFLNIGVESASSQTQKFLRRGQLDNADILKTVRWCEDSGIKVRLQNMIGLPVEDPLADAIQTFEFNKLCRPTDSSGTIYQPLPGTELWAYCVKTGLIDDRTWPSGYFDKTILKIKDAEKINRLGKYWHWAVKEAWPTALLLRRLEKPLSEEEMKKMVLRAQAECKKDLYGI